MFKERRREEKLCEYLAEEERRSSSMEKRRIKKSQNSKVLNCSMHSIKCTGQKAIYMHIRSRGHQIREHQAEIASVTQQLVSHYAFLAAAPSGLDSAVHGGDKRALNKGDNH